MSNHHCTLAPRRNIRDTLRVRPAQVAPYSSGSYPHRADKEWTREETDYLLKTVHEFDVRWYIIHDRYDFPGGPPRSLDV